MILVKRMTAGFRRGSFFLAFDQFDDTPTLGFVNRPRQNFAKVSEILFAHKAVHGDLRKTSRSYKFRLRLNGWPVESTVRNTTYRPQ
jgi:hypothetical protein